MPLVPGLKGSDACLAGLYLYVLSIHKSVSTLGLPFSEKKFIPCNTEQTEILIHSVGIPPGPRNRKCSEFRSEPFYGR